MNWVLTQVTGCDLALLCMAARPMRPFTQRQIGVQSTMTLSSKIIGIQSLQKGESVGYGSTFVADKSMLIGVVACGYADGYPRHCSTGTPVLVNGVRTQMVGRVSMDMLTVDLTPLQVAGLQFGIGSEITLWGNAKSGAVLSIDEVAKSAGTVGYELMCALAQRVPVLVDDNLAS